MNATVNDVIDNPAFRREIEDLNYRYDLAELQRCQETGLPVSKALWRRIMRYRRERSC